MSDSDLIERAWAIIANAGGGDWKKETDGWQEAAADWREHFHAWLDRQRQQADPSHVVGGSTP